MDVDERETPHTPVRLDSQVWHDPLVKKTIKFVTLCHEGQVDKLGVSYIHHVMSVSWYMGELGLDAVLIALLHDVVEDTDTTLADLRSLGYSESVVSGVDAVTRRDDETYAAYINRAAQHPLGRAVKLADNAHNRSRLHLLPKDEADRLRPRYAAACESLVMDGPWYARKNDTIGGWCVMPVDLPPSTGIPTVGDFMNESVARYVAYTHNKEVRRSTKTVTHTQIKIQ